MLMNGEGQGYCSKVFICICEVFQDDFQHGCDLELYLFILALAFQGHTVIGKRYEGYACYKLNQSIKGERGERAGGGTGGGAGENNLQYNIPHWTN